MDFTRVLQATIGILVLEGRVSYRRLQAEFGLSEAQLAAIKIEVTEVRPLAVDQDGRFLAWVGSGSPDAFSVKSGSANGMQVAAQQPSQNDPTTESIENEAERRPLTVMFCDLADSTELSVRHDPEELQDVIGAYRECCSDIIREYEGYIAKYMGDGILVYFGYPKSSEHNADRAIRTGLAIVEAMADLNLGLGRETGIEFAVRIGIATGQVVVGELVGEGLAQERTVIGEAPNVAARLQSVAPRNGIVIGRRTKDVAGDVFLYEDLGEHELKGLAGPIRTFGVIGLRTEAVEDEAGGKGSITVPPVLIGRDEEIGLLRRAWQSTKDEGRGRIVVISGEPGIGKTTLINTLRTLARAEGMTRMTFRCSAYHTNSALYPVIEHIRKIAGWQIEDTPELRLSKIESMLEGYNLTHGDAILLLAALLSLTVPEDRYAPLKLTPQQLKQRTEDLLVALALEEAERRPVLYIWEDLHWADPSTLDFLGLLAEQAPTAPILMVFSFRPEFAIPWPPRSHLTPITLSRLERPQIESLVKSLAGDRTLPGDVLEYIVSKTDGVPLYIEELTKTILRSDVLRQQQDRYVLTGSLSDVDIPTSLQESLLARLDRLPTMRQVAQLGAVLGREFAYEVLDKIGVLEESQLRDGLGQLVDAELLYQRGRPPLAKYIFKHALIQDAAYQSLLKRTRQQYHRQVAEILQSNFPEMVEVQPELLAHHMTEAGRTSDAVTYWQRAGEKAVQRSANREAVDQLTKALEQLATLPDTAERAERELCLQSTLGPAVMAMKGYASPDASAVYTRARELARVTGHNENIGPLLFGAWSFNLVAGNHRVAWEVGEDLLELAEKVDDPGPRLYVHHALGVSSIYMGTPAKARAHFEQVLNLYDRNAHQGLAFGYGVDVGAMAQAYSAWPLWLLGHPEQAREAANRAAALSGQISHSFTQSRTSYLNAIVHLFLKDAAQQDWAKQALQSAKAQGYELVLTAAPILEAAALTRGCQHADGSKQISEGIKAYHATGARFQSTHYLVILAEALGAAGTPDKALKVLAEAATIANRCEERYCEAEIHRLRGEFLLAQSESDFAEADQSLHQALDLARGQQAKSLELRAAISLARRYAGQGREQDGRDLLAPVYACFTEGFETADLKDAKALLDELA